MLAGSVRLRLLIWVGTRKRGFYEVQALTQPNPPAFAPLSPKKRILPDWFFEAHEDEQEDNAISALSQALCADARERIEAALHGSKDNEEPTLDEVLADLFEDVDDELRGRLLCPLYDTWCAVAKEVVPYDLFVFRCTYDLVFALHALEPV